MGSEEAELKRWDATVRTAGSRLAVRPDEAAVNLKIRRGAVM